MYNILQIYKHHTMQCWLTIPTTNTKSPNAA